MHQVQLLQSLPGRSRTQRCLLAECSQAASHWSASSQKRDAVQSVRAKEERWTSTAPSDRLLAIAAEGPLEQCKEPVDFRARFRVELPSGALHPQRVAE